MLNIFKKRNTTPQNDLQSILGGYELPSFPATVMNVLTALRDPDFSMTSVAKQLEGDPGLHVKILKTVNSSAFGLTTRVMNLHRAVALLGRSRLETIVLSQAVHSVLPNVDMPYFNMKEFWHSAAKRASLARVLALHLHPATQIESFTSGLLQDMALPILITVKPKEYSNIFERWKCSREISFNKLEIETIGFDHSTTGALIAKEWGLPEYLINAILYHHIENKNIDVEPAIVIVSHIRDNYDENIVDKLVELCTQKYGMDAEKVVLITKTALENAEEFSQMLA
ncbi:MAG: HDOD domain-containing protein [Candidatus Latescibacteria bacterium]|nr:HDOD domain-containing protein [Candidatus Latescibacterota bacterium]